jgi:hypothetical protein
VCQLFLPRSAIGEQKHTVRDIPLQDQAEQCARVVSAPLFGKARISRVKELEAQVAQSWVIIGAAPECPVIFAI